MQKNKKNNVNILYRAVLELKSEEECSKFFADLCTFQELESLSQRLQVAGLLDEGKSYTEINQKTGASTATICRVSRCLNYGDGGYKTVLDRLKGENDEF